ncbi:MAG: hypothetical protein AABY15_05195 [Nanoarchaeota archaeon]
MKVKIGDKIYDANEEPIMLILNDADKNNIANMHSDKYKYAAFPDEMDIEEVKEFMKLDSNG